MPIVSSVFRRNSLQPSGVRQIVEHHADHVGMLHMRSRYAPAGDDVDAKMAAYAASLPDELAVMEEQQNLQHLYNGGDPAELKFDWTDSGDEVKLVCIVFMQAGIENSIPLRPTVSGYSNAEITAFFTNPERQRIQSHAGGLLAIEAQIQQFNADKEVFFDIDLSGLELP